MFRFRLSIFLGGILAVTAGGQDLNPGGFLGFTGDDAGVPTLSFLKLPVSARDVALGGRSLTTDEEASVIHGNPAGLGLVSDYFYSLSHAEILGEFRHEDFALSWPTRSIGTFGAAANLLTTGPIGDSRDIDENPATPSAFDLDVSLAYGHPLLNGRITAGGRLDYIHSALDGTAADGYALTGGLLFFLFHDLRLSTSLHNLSHGIRYENTGPIEPLPLGLGVEVGKPLMDSRWSAQVGLLHGNEGVAKLYGGGEYRVMKYLILRGGYEGVSQDRELEWFTGISAGVGIKYDRVTLDYGWKSLGALGSYHAVTLNYSRKATFRDPDAVFLERSQEQRRKGHYAKALALARKAVLANPYNFKAQALAKQLELEIEGMDETAFSIYYTASNDGALASQWIEGRAIGGLARRRTKLLELKGVGGKSLVVDAGDLTNPAALTGQEKYVQAAYALMPYDAVNVGAGELLIGADKWDARIPMLSTQEPLPRSHGALLREKTLSLKSGMEVKVIGALDPASVKGEALGGAELEAVAETARRAVEGGRGKRLVILLLHGSLTFARDVALRVPDLCAIILSGESQSLGSPIQVGKTLLCSPGRRGTRIGHLLLTLDKQGGVRSFRHQLIPLDASVAEDPDIKRLFEGVTVDPNQMSIDDYDEDYRAQVLAYIHAPAPGAAGRLHLRDLRTGKDYSILAGGLACSRPLLGYGKNKVAFIGTDSAGPDGARGPSEVYTADPGLGRLDTLTRKGGEARDIRWILGNNALLTLYRKDGASALYRVDPWSREMRDLSRGRFGDVAAFDVSKAGDRVAVVGAGADSVRLWVTDLNLESPLPIVAEAAPGGFAGSPRWSPDGKRLAYLLRSADGDHGNTDATSGELRVFDFEAKQPLAATVQSRVREFSWSADGKRIYYVAGVNLVDINEFSLDSLLLRKVTSGEQARSEENPTPKVFEGRDGLLFEATADAPGAPRRVLWLDLKTGTEKALVDSTGWNSLK
jgi:Tol biopolymer transport system component